jgi:hypothetical protein
MSADWTPLPLRKVLYNILIYLVDDWRVESAETYSHQHQWHCFYARGYSTLQI